MNFDETKSLLPPTSLSKSKSKSKTKSKSKSRSKSRSKSKSKSKSKTKSRNSEKKVAAAVATTETEAKANIVLKMPEILPDEINYNDKIAKKMERMFKEQDKLEPNIGVFYLANLFYLYLFNKYKMSCVLTSNRNKIAIKLYLKIPEHPTPKSEREQEAETRYNISNLLGCIMKKHKVIIIPFSITYTIKDKEHGHANLLIYRQNTQVIEHFEPHGNAYYGTHHEVIRPKIEEYLANFIHLLNESIRNSDDEEFYNLSKQDRVNFVATPLVTLINSFDVCPVVKGVQALEGNSCIPLNAAIEPAGYCSAWSMFFTELCLKNPDVSSRDIYASIMAKTNLYSNKNDYLRNVIRGYTSYINNKIEKYFSVILDEPISTRKIKVFYDKIENKPVNEPTPEDINQYFIKLNQIIIAELDPNNRQNKTGERYNTFKQTIRSATSSSDEKSQIDNSSNRRKIRSPARIPIKVSPANSPAKSVTNAKSKTVKAKAGEIDCPYPLFFNKKTGECEPCPAGTFLFDKKCIVDRSARNREKELLKASAKADKDAAKKDKDAAKDAAKKDKFVAKKDK
jgi:hypothetical protein